MSKIQKSALTVNGDTIRVAMPFAKVDKKRRLVHGYATLDNIDTQGDVVLAEASAKAFARARGNIREMHQPIAAGHLVSFKEEEFFHEGEFYRGIFVSAYVSKGAESTWEKVLDGTLTGFSIGGEINEADHEFVKDANGGKGANVRFIKDYDLTELSLVDNPANQLANVVSFQKMADGSVDVTMGEVADTVVENVFICTADDTVVVKSTESEVCPVCEEKMENAGWFETGDNRAEKVSEIVTKFLNPGEGEGGVEMAKKEEVVPEEKTTSVPNPSETFEDGTPIEDEAEPTVEGEAADVDETEEEEEVEKSASPEEVVDEADEIAKRITDLQDAITDSMTKNQKATEEQVAALEEKINQALTKSSELEAKIDEFGQRIEVQKSNLANFEKKLDKMNASGAIKKSAGVEPVVEEVQSTSFWHGAFSD